jgi:hypothetical protein
MWWTYALVALGGLVVGFIITSIVVSKRRDSYAREHEEFVQWVNDEMAKKMKQKEKNKENK